MPINQADAAAIVGAIFRAVDENPSRLALFCWELRKAFPAVNWVQLLTANITEANTSPGLSLTWFRDEIARYYAEMT